MNRVEMNSSTLVMMKMNRRERPVPVPGRAPRTKSQAIKTAGQNGSPQGGGLIAHIHMAAGS